ncbi:major histocompatibility complex class I-related gene protein-like isoform X2 [Anabas testudineus]|uniref:major histocompatibility complex class I-related gene protein-like isoform X2 n=1 Tax=Anabas testudineus TaxID=64144 RepID=UPI00143CCC62|nr:major histocompatibility complex class I-related gene protein-like isoform X2 [Anabas testudineus]
MKTFTVLLLFCHIAFPMKHSLKFILTSSSGISSFPEFVAVGVVDDVEIGYCDSNSERPEPRTRWMEKIIQNDPQQQDWYTGQCFKIQDNLRANIEGLKQRFNKSEGVDILQRMNGCEWDDKTGDIRGFIQFGYNGDDFITLDLETLTWVAPTSQAVITKHEWDRERSKNLHWKNVLTQLCSNYLKKYVTFGKVFLQSTDRPSVSLLQKTPSSPVSCHATGFYPDRASMFWRKDGEEIQEDVDHGEILHNHDGTFQMRVDLNISSVKPEDWSRYDCVFQFSDVKKDVITKLDKAVIRTNHEFPVAVIGVVVGLLLLLVCITGLFIWRKMKNNGFQPANKIDEE